MKFVFNDKSFISLNDIFTISDRNLSIYKHSHFLLFLLSTTNR